MLSSLSSLLVQLIRFPSLSLSSLLTGNPTKLESSRPPLCSIINPPPSIMVKQHSHLSLSHTLKMINFVCFGKKLDHFYEYSLSKLSHFHQSYRSFSSSSFRALLFRVNPFWTQLLFFVVSSFVGFLLLNVTNTRPSSLSSSSKPKKLDMFFTSVSASTVSSMSTVEMEVFSNTQLVILTILMLLGGEVFISFLGLQFIQKQAYLNNKFDSIVNMEYHFSNPLNYDDGQIESNGENLNKNDLENGEKPSNGFEDYLKYKAIKCLGYVVLGYFLVVHLCGSFFVYLYVTLISRHAKDILEKKGIRKDTFSVFTTVSTFANCGFVPTNENMMVFAKDSGLLMLLITQILIGNTLFPTCLRLVIWVLEKGFRRVEFGYLLKNGGREEMKKCYGHLMSSFESIWLGVSVLGFVLVQFVVFCCMEWTSEVMDGLNVYEKVVGSLFEVVNSRHSGESIFDLSILSPSILVLFVVMMYLPPYTSFLPAKDHKEEEEEEEASKNGKKCMKEKKKKLVEYLLFSQLSYLTIFVGLICITEGEKMKEDPLNFNVLNIILEVISAYGNVGFSTGYSCKRRLKTEDFCEDKMFGFVGRWSNKGKVILILVMFFGRLKKFNMNGGSFWKLSYIASLSSLSLNVS